MKYLVFGSKGQLGLEFISQLQSSGLECIGYDIEELDITSQNQLASAIENFKPGVIINCAAYNQVDAAELNPDPAFAVNSEAVSYIAQAASQLGAFVVHFGSDYVFDGNKTTGLYSERDAANPINLYGKSKLAGENYLKESGVDYLIFRLSWVYGAGTQNFIYKLRQWAASSKILKIASDEVSVPTSTKTIVEATMKSIKIGLSGIYHLAGSGYASRYEWAKEILRLTRKNNIIYPVSRDSFNLPAKRPYFSAMDNSAISKDIATEIPYWQDSLSVYLSDHP